MINLALGEVNFFLIKKFKFVYTPFYDSYKKNRSTKSPNFHKGSQPHIPTQANGTSNKLLRSYFNHTLAAKK